MKRPVAQSDGMFHLKGKTFKILTGSRQQVWNKTAYKTPGGLTRKDLIQNKHRRIVSRKKHFQSKKEQQQGKRLFAKYTAQKGKFGAVEKKMKNKK